MTKLLVDINMTLENMSFSEASNIINKMTSVFEQTDKNHINEIVIKKIG